MMDHPATFLKSLNPIYDCTKTVQNVLMKAQQEKFIFIRMVAWGATHDYNQSGIPEKNLDQLINIVFEFKFNNIFKRVFSFAWSRIKAKFVSS